MEWKVKYQRYLKLSAALQLGIVILLLILSQFISGRIDLSRSKQFSISEYSRNLLGELGQNLTIRYYLSSELELRLAQSSEIRNYLSQLRGLHPGLIDVEIIRADESMGLEQLGISSQSIEVVDGNSQQRRNVYSGITLSYGSQTEVIPEIFQMDSLEYELAAALTRLIHGTPRVNMLIARQAEDVSYEIAQEYLGRLFDVNVLSPGEDLPPSEVLLVFGTDQLGATDMNRIRQSMRSGSPMVLSADSARADLLANLSALPMRNASSSAFLAELGIELGASWVLDSINNPIPVQEEQGSQRVQGYRSYPPWIHVNSDAMANEHPLSSIFTGLDLYWASPISYDPEDDRITPLLYSSSTALADAHFTSDPLETQDLLDNSGPIGPQLLALEFNGELSSNLQDGSSDKTAARFILIGDGDFASDLVQFTSAQYNLTFLRGLIEYLCGYEELLALNGPSIDMSLTGGNEGVASARLKLAALVSVCMLPATFFAWGGIRLFRRRAFGKGRPS